ncbi:MAG: hypothetical protein AAFY64_10455, partial [Pseudomonadota bacterium]
MSHNATSELADGAARAGNARGDLFARVAVTEPSPPSEHALLVGLLSVPVFLMSAVVGIGAFVQSPEPALVVKNAPPLPLVRPGTDTKAIAATDRLARFALPSIAPAVGPPLSVPEPRFVLASGQPLLAWFKPDAYKELPLRRELFASAPGVAAPKLPPLPDIDLGRSAAVSAAFASAITKPQTATVLALRETAPDFANVQLASSRLALPALSRPSMPASGWRRLIEAMPRPQMPRKIVISVTRFALPVEPAEKRELPERGRRFAKTPVISIPAVGAGTPLTRSDRDRPHIAPSAGLLAASLNSRDLSPGLLALQMSASREPRVTVAANVVLPRSGFMRGIAEQPVSIKRSRIVLASLSPDFARPAIRPELRDGPSALGASGILAPRPDWLSAPPTASPPWVESVDGLGPSQRGRCTAPVRFDDPWQPMPEMPQVSFSGDAYGVALAKAALRQS